MASVFTYEPEPPRVSSPWPRALDARAREITESHNVDAGLSPCSISRLEPEPQDGPVEYKLHLLLRPRRRLLASTTILRVSGSTQSRIRESRVSSASTSSPTLLPTLPTPSNQSRQNRLQNLTTQLLWRLQQSSPHHSASKSDLVVPTLLDVHGKPRLTSNARGKLLPGLAESQGALYEIGVSDDGELVGLVRDELDESLSNLRIMAHSLGCKVRVLRDVIVGECRWMEDAQSATGSVQRQKEDALWVLEALIAPDLDSQASILEGPDVIDRSGVADPELYGAGTTVQQQESDQLRVCLTGSTTSGKSSLLAILSTSTLDDGRGKVRKSLHKHLHEIASGVTSSLVTELIGYRDSVDGERTNVVNYASDNVSQWTDIHEACKKGRLVAVTDSAGHLKYRRTTVRGLLSWAPHWTVCCIAADNEPIIQEDTGQFKEERTLSNRIGSIGFGSNSWRAHLELCLDLGLPLVVAITKLDLAMSSGLRKIVGEVLTCLKAAGRQVVPMFTNNSPASDQELQSLLPDDLQECSRMFSQLSAADSVSIVPVLLISAVSGAGIRRLHAVFRHLPIPAEPQIMKRKYLSTNPVAPRGLFHIDEVFATSDARSIALLNGSKLVEGHVISGHLSQTPVRLGDTCFVGPFDVPSSFAAHTTGNRMYHARSCPTLKQTSIETKASSSSPRVTSESLTSPPGPKEDQNYDFGTWRRVKVISLRNLRLPVRQLLPGQIGTIGIADEHTLQEGYSSNKRAFGGRIRKGMVMIRDYGNLTIKDLPAYQGFVADFPPRDERTIVPGSLVMIYVASVRAPAKVLCVRGLPATPPPHEMFALEEIDNSTMPLDSGKVNTTRQQTEATFGLQASREWLELDSQVLVMVEQGDSGPVGLNGFVGKITRLLN